MPDSDELVNRDCLGSLQMANVFHSCVLYFPKEEPTFLLCATKCSILICSSRKESPLYDGVFPDNKIITEVREMRDISGENSKKDVLLLRVISVGLPLFCPAAWIQHSGTIYDAEAPV